MAAAVQTKVIRENVDPADIAEEFVIREMIKMFPEARQEFYDHIRYYVRQYRNQYNADRFWRLIAGLSSGYMLKGHYRMLRGNAYRWSLEEVPLEGLRVKMFGGKIGELLESVDYKPVEAGKILKELDSEERKEYLYDPIDFNRDNYPILVHEDDSEGSAFVLHDGNRRTMNAAVLGFETLQAYVGRKTEYGKPALREDFLADLVKVIKDSEKVDDTVIESLITVLKEFKKNYSNGPYLVDMYIKDHVIPDLGDNKEAISKAEEVLEIRIENNGNGNGYYDN